MDKTSPDRIKRAVELFNSGYNCAQAVCAAWADCYGMSEKQMLLVASSFGGGIGRMRKTCGAACGMFLLAGLETGTTDPKNHEQKGANYKVVQRLAAEFTARNGALDCADLLSGKNIAVNKNPSPEARTPEYYKKRPCPQIVEEAARIWKDYLDGQLSD